MASHASDGRSSAGVAEFRWDPAGDWSADAPGRARSVSCTWAFRWISELGNVVDLERWFRPWIALALVWDGAARRGR